MTSAWKIVILGACIAGGSLVYWVHREKAIEWKKLSDAGTETRARAEQGDAKAEANLGRLYSHGQGVPQDYAEALRWYRKAADQGDANGQDGLASAYYYGRGVPQDYTEAFHWYRKSAEQGDAGGEDGLAIMYSRGQGMQQDYAEALRWYREAAGQGYAKAQYNLGNMYYYGRGVPQDRAEAERWYHKAADQGDEYAQRALGLKGPGLTGWRTISLLAMLLGGWVALNGSLWPQRSLRYQQSRALTVAGVCGLASIGLSIYWDFSVFRPVSAVSALHFATNLAAGITVAMLITVFGPKSAKVVLCMSSILLSGSYLFLIAHHERMRLSTPIRGFSSINGLLIGIAVPLAVFLWVETIKRRQGQTETE